jgi:cytoskeleton protein RodZ
MGSFGERMQREREMRSISLDEIAESTKIGARLLRALEEEEFDKLPGGIFNKGFVRAYSRYLGLDEEQAVTDFIAAQAESEQKNRDHANQDQAKISAQVTSRNGNLAAKHDNVYEIRASADTSAELEPPQAAGFMRALVAIVIVLGVGGFAWKYLGTRAAAAKSSAAQALQSATAQPRSSVPAATSPAPESLTPVYATAIEPSKPEAQKLNASSDKSTTAETEKPVPASSESKHSDLKPSDSTKVSLEIHTTEESWAQVKADGAILWKGTMSASSNHSFRAEKELVVILGNAPGVELSYNGKPLPRFASDTKTKTLTFTTDGLTTR